MKPFDYYQPTEIRFGAGRVGEVGQVVAARGSTCLLTTVPEFPALAPVYAAVKESLASAGVAVVHFDQVRPNPTLANVTAAADMGRDRGADVVLGLGGGSAIDTAKAAAVALTHPGTAWDYLFFRDTQPTEATLPIVAVTTTSGTGSQVTKVSVIAREAEKCKSALCHPNLFPGACIVDPALMRTVPPAITASTGWDVFTHAFESYINVNHSDYVDRLALEAIRLVAANLPGAVEDGSDLAARSAMAWADTLAGMCIANVGTTLPHAMGQPISGHCPQVTHGQSLAVVYPAFTRFTWASAVERFAAVGRVLDPALAGEPETAAAEKACDAIDDLLKRIGMYTTLDDLGVPENEMDAILAHCMEFPDGEGNPRVATREEVRGLYDRVRG